MNIALIVNFILAAIAVGIFLKFLSDRKSARIHMEHYEDELHSEIAKRKEIELQYQNQIQSLKNNTRANITSQPANNAEAKSMVDSLVLEINKLRTEKEQELKSRLEAEKQIDLAIQKTTDIQSKIDDWKIMQESNLKDATDTIVKASNNLYERLIISQQEEIDIIRNKVDETVKNIYDYLEKIVKQVQFLNVHNIDSKNAVNAAININSDAVNVDHNSRNLEGILKSAHLQPGIDYFMHHNLPEEVKKSVLCESVIAINSENIIIVDIKSARFFLELFSSRARGEENAEENFQQKMDRYLTYLANQKYRSNVINYFSKQQIIIPEASSSLVMLVPSDKEVEAFQELGEQYMQILENNNISLHSLKSLSNLIFGE